MAITAFIWLSCRPYNASATIVSAAPLLCATTMNFLVNG